MPKPARIEYEGAFHHVMNHGRSHQNIYHGNVYFEAFVNALKEVSELFNTIIHAYCLLSNHYHLLIETPKANLGRITFYRCLELTNLKKRSYQRV